MFAGMSIAGSIKGSCILLLQILSEGQIARRPPGISLAPADWERSLRDPTSFYAECVRYFHSEAPVELRRHRAYFHNVRGNRRGYGENAFHTLWYLLLERFRPRNFLEIGVFRGQVISLVALWASLRSLACEVWGISPFSSAGDSVSTYRKDIDYYQDTLRNFEHFKLPPPGLLRAYSTDAEALQFIGSRQWEMIYIDGNHDYEVARKDWEACSRSLKPGGIIVLDDSGLTTGFRPPIFATKGHPGPSQLAREVDRARFREVLQVGHNRAFQRLP